MSQKNKSTFCNWKNQPFSRFFKKAADFFGCRWFIFTWLSAVRFQWSRKKEERHQRLFGTDIALRSNSPLMWRSNVIRLRFIPTGQRPWWWFPACSSHSRSLSIVVFILYLRPPRRLLSFRSAVHRSERYLRCLYIRVLCLSKPRFFVGNIVCFGCYMCYLL